SLRMAPGRGFLQSVILLASLAGITVADAMALTEEQLPRYKFRHSSSSQHPSEWIAGPNGYLYQFHIGEQSWLAAREFCLAENADLVSIKTKDQLDWILLHYAPTHPSFEERFVQIGLVSVGDSSQFSWVDGPSPDLSIIDWSASPIEGNRCVHLKINEKKVESINCDSPGSTQHINRFICQRSTTAHQEQQRSNNYIWRKLENLFNYFGFASEKEAKGITKRDEEDDYWQAVESLTEEEKKIFIETAKNLTTADEPERTTLAEVEGSGEEEKTISEVNSASREEKIVDEHLREDEGLKASEKREEHLKEVEETLTVLKEGREEVKAETALLPIRKMKREDEEDELNKPLLLRELLDTEEGSGSSLTENAHIENIHEDSDLLASPTPSTEGDIDKMIEKMEKLLDDLQGNEKKEIGPIIIEKASTPSPSSTLIPIGPIIIEKAKEEKTVEDSAKENLPEAESVEASKEKSEEKKEEKKEEENEEERKEEKK
ncbi:hypothetical protein PMAYCL1PPCAC_18667, partial [Pristionchus mayeri]